MSTESKIKKYTGLIKSLALVVFAILIFLAIYKKPEMPEEVRKNFREVEFHTIGGPNADSGWSVVQVKDGGYLIAADTASYGAGSSDAYLIKTNKDGELDWTRTFGGQAKDTAISAVQAKDGGYILTGGTMSSGYGETDVLVVKTDKDGETIWEKTYGGANHDQAYSIKSTAGGYVIVGYSSSFSELNSDVYLLKIDENGKEIFEKTFGGYSWDIGYDIAETKDKGFIITGYTDSTAEGKTDIYLIKTDSKGNSMWAKMYGGKREDRGYSVIQTKDNGYLIAGKTTSYISKGFGWDIIVIKTDSLGNSLWSRFLPASETEVGSSIIEETDGYLIAGTKKCYGICDSNVYITKLDLKGDTLWYRIFAGKSDDTANSIIKDVSGGYLITGSTLSYGYGRGDILFMKISEKGEQIW